MKVNSKFKIKVFALLASLVLVAFGFVAWANKINKSEELNATFVATKDFSGVDENNVVFQMEKVAVAAITGTDTSGLPSGLTYTSPLYNDPAHTQLLEDYTISAEEVKNASEEVVGYKPYYYKKINKGSISKYTVGNGNFVMLNNALNNDGLYVNNSWGNAYLEDGTPVAMQEAIMVSLGQFVYSNGSYNKASAESYWGKNVPDGQASKINYTASVSVKYNGNSYALPIRQYSEGYADFAFVVPQLPEYEGLWEIEFNAVCNGRPCNGSFSFYLVFNTSYTGTVTDPVTGGNSYTIEPNIRYEGRSLVPTNGTLTYFLADGNSYPVVTYDYTKYRMSYTHTANNNTTNYSYTRTYYTQETLHGTVQRARLDCAMSGSKNGVVSYNLNRYQSNRTNNLVSIVLSDVGYYSISFEYIYTAKTSGGLQYENSALSAAFARDLPLSNSYLEISGVELNYHANRTHTQMRKVVFANNENLTAVDLIIPSGYLEGTTPQVDKFMYELNTTSTARLGNVVQSEGGSLNQKLNNSINASGNPYLDDYNSKKVATKLSNLTPSNYLSADKDDLKEFFKNFYTVFNNIEYPRTNQGFIDLTTNNEYNWDESFYFFSPSESKIEFKYNPDDTEDDGSAGLERLQKMCKKYMRSTNFDNVGYYLVFLKTKDNLNPDTSAQEYTIFAFEHSTDARDLSCHEYENGIIGRELSSNENKFTNKDVLITWNARGVFEKEIRVNYKTSLTDGVFSGNGVDITNDATLSEDGKTYSYVVSLSSGYRHYRATINIVGASAISSDFTIDKQPISGIAVYKVKEFVNILNNRAYAYDSDMYGNRILLDSITNTLAGITWADKASGAGIDVEYTKTKFSQNSAETDKEIEFAKGIVGYTTPYKLGETSGKNYEIKSNTDFNVLSEQGIYVFTFTDKAGNSCKYLFIVDKTETYFKITDTKEDELPANDEIIYTTNTSLLYYNNVSIEVASHKVFELENIADSSANEDVSTMRALIALAGANANNEDWQNVGYYLSSNNNIATLKNLFLTENNKTYITVPNKRVEVFNDTLAPQTNENKTINSIGTTRFRTVHNSSNPDIVSTVRYYYLVGANNYYDAEEGGSCIYLEVNTDSSLAMAFRSNQNNFNDSTIKAAVANPNYKAITRLLTSTGSVGFTTAKATSDNYVAFTWFEGEGDNEIKNLSYYHYTLGDYCPEDAQHKYAYYSVSSGEKFLCQEGSSTADVHSFVDDNGNRRAYAVINITSVAGGSADGLYVITREYKNNNETLSYYFIIDRNEIIVAENLIVGGAIQLELDGGLAFKNFSSYSSAPELLNYGVKTDYTYNLPYRVYLNNVAATKLPATFRVPVSKFFDGTNLNSYYSGKLKVSLYFKDTNNQLSQFISASNLRQAYKIYEADVNRFEPNGNYFEFDITQGNELNEWESKFIVNSNNKNWLTMPGDYILVIEDKVESTNGAHVKTIGFRINGGAQYIPYVDAYATSDSSLISEEINSIYHAQYSEGAYKLSTNKEFIKINIPAVDETSTKAQIDNTYVDISYKVGNSENATTYLRVNGGSVTGVARDMNLYNAYTMEDGKLSSITLCTFLRTSGLNNFINTDGDVVADYVKQLTYTIKVRYKCSNTSAFYYYENGQKQYYYNAEYTVVIDRVPPTENITHLQAEDEFKQYYEQESAFETTYKDNKKEGVVFATRYAKYYSTNNINDVYAFSVGRQTAFINTDVAKVYYNKITNFASYTLANLFAGDYVFYNQMQADAISEYGQLFANGATDGFYEIVEEDAVGNLTQYVVLYDAGNVANKLELQLNYKTNGTSANESATKVLSTNQTAQRESLLAFSFESATSAIRTSAPENTTYDVHYVVEIYNSSKNTRTYIKTGLKTNFALIGQNFVSTIEDLGYGIYTVYIRARALGGEDSVYGVYDLHYYQNYVLTVEPNKLIKSSASGYYLDLTGINETVVDEKGNSTLYYISKAELTSSRGGTITYLIKYENGLQFYVNNFEPENRFDGGIVALSSGDYYLKMEDSSKQTYTLRFNTSNPVFERELTFGDSDKLYNNEYYLYNGTYYAFNSALIRYNALYYDQVKLEYKIGVNGTVFTKILAEGNDGDIEENAKNFIICELVPNNISSITILPYFNNYTGGIIYATITFLNGGEEEGHYNIVLDSRYFATGELSPSLKDNKNNETKMKFEYNVNYQTTTPESISTGTRYLRWSNGNDVEGLTFSFDYRLIEEFLDGTFEQTALNSVNAATIQPHNNSSGKFRFVIYVIAPNGRTIGNLVYTFYIQADSNELYTVMVGGSFVSENSSITIEEMLDDAAFDISEGDIKSSLGMSASEVLPKSLSISLYVRNELVEVHEADDAIKNRFTASYRNNTLTLYRISRGNDVRYVATLQIEKYVQLVSNLRVNNTQYGTNSQTLYGQASYSLQFTRLFGSANNIGSILLKNTLSMEVNYNHNYVKTITFAPTLGEISHKLSGSGLFNYRFIDLAGNVAELTFLGSGETSDYLNITTLNQLAVSVNDVAPIPNGFYNNSAVVKILNTGAIDRNTLSVRYSRNYGNSVPISSSNYTYIFTAPGWYRVELMANVLNSAQTISRIVEFSIINPNEAYTMFNFGNKNVQIKYVTNTYGKDVTDSFNRIINENGGVITHSLMQENSAILGVGYGKQHFTVTYTCEDNIYPTRETSFVFTLNNEQPSLSCSLASGDSSTKGFDLSFNPGEIYRQVGDCTLYVYKDYIGGTIVQVRAINAYSNNGIEEINISRGGAKDDGAYYIVLQSGSGNIISSSKVYLKEPLNSSAIIIIVVVSLAVAAVVVTIILLRRKMRIR